MRIFDMDIEKLTKDDSERCLNLSEGNRNFITKQFSKKNRIEKFLYTNFRFLPIKGLLNVS